MDFEEEWELWHFHIIRLYEALLLSLSLGKVFGECRTLGKFLFLSGLRLGIRYPLAII